MNFNQDVGGTLGLEDLIVVNSTTNASVSLQSLTYDPITHAAIVTFLPATLANGNYRLSIGAGSINGLVSAHSLDSFVLAGDANRDRVVNFDDLLLLAQHDG